MYSIEQLKQAYKYPFLRSSASIAKNLDLNLENIPNKLLAKSYLILLNTSKKKKLETLDIYSNSDFLIQHILAYRISVLALSLLEEPQLYSNFAELYSNMTFENLEHEENDHIFDIANELKIKFALVDNTEYFCKLDIISYLSTHFKQDNMKLVNQRVSGGYIWLTRNEFIRFITGYVNMIILNSLPEKIDFLVPQNFIDFVEQLKKDVISKQKREFEIRIMGKVKPRAFPPCMATYYSLLLEGQNIPHMARFNLATFLAAIGMPVEQIIDVFKHAPNFNERVTTYQVQRIVGDDKNNPKYTPASCAKMKEAGLCIHADNLCEKINHPLQYYKIKRREVRDFKKRDDSEKKIKMKRLMKK